MSDLIQEIEKAELRDDTPDFAPGDTIRVLYNVRESEKERIQVFAGLVIGRRGHNPNWTVHPGLSRQSAGQRYAPATPPDRRFATGLATQPLHSRSVSTTNRNNREGSSQAKAAPSGSPSEIRRASSA